MIKIRKVGGWLCVLYALSLDFSEAVILAITKLFLLLGKLGIGADYTHEVDTNLFDDEGSDKEAVRHMVVHHSVSVLEVLLEEYMLLFTNVPKRVDCWGLSFRRVVQLNFKPDSVGNGTVAEQIHGVASVEDTARRLEDVSFGAAAIPDDEADELGKEEGGDENAHDLPLEHVREIEVFRSRESRVRVQLTELQDSRDHHD